MPPRNAHDVGEHRYNAKLTESDVLAIRSAYDLGASPAKLARQYGYSGAAMYRVCKRIMWKHLP